MRNLIVLILSFGLIFYSSSILGQSDSIELHKNINDEVDSTCYWFPEVSAKFQNGDLNDFCNYFLQNFIIPPLPDSIPIFTKLIFSFCVDSDGMVTNIKIIKSLGYDLLDKELIRFLSNTPKWEPARNSSQKVCQIFIIPINYEFQ
jgi:hypothetical protein